MLFKCIEKFEKRRPVVQSPKETVLTSRNFKLGQPKVIDGDTAPSSFGIPSEYLICLSLNYFWLFEID